MNYYDGFGNNKTNYVLNLEEEVKRLRLEIEQLKEKLEVKNKMSQKTMAPKDKDAELKTTSKAAGHVKTDQKSPGSNPV